MRRIGRRFVLVAAVSGVLGAALPNSIALAQAPAQPPAAAGQQGLPGEIVPFVGADTVAVAHLNLAKIDIKAVRKWLDDTAKAAAGDDKQQAGGIGQQIDPALKKAEDWLTNMRQAGAQDVYFVGGGPKNGEVPNGLMIVPTTKASNADRIRTLITPSPDDVVGSPNLATTVTSSAVVLGEKKDLDRLAAAKGGGPANGGGAVSPSLLQALDAVHQSTAYLVIATDSPAVRQSLKATANMFGRAEGDQNGAQKALDQTEWIAWGFDTPPQGGAKFVLKATSADAGKQMQQQMQQHFAQLGQSPDVAALNVKDLQQTLALLTPKAEGDRLVLSLSGDQINQLFLKGAAAYEKAMAAAAKGAAEPQPAPGRQPGAPGGTQPNPGAGAGQPGTPAPGR